MAITSSLASLIQESRAFFRRGIGPIHAYSEWMPPPFVGVKPSGAPDPFSVGSHEPVRWIIQQQEWLLELAPGLESIGRQMVHKIGALRHGDAHHFSQAHLRDNPAWPASLREHSLRAGRRDGTLILPLAFSKTQDDKGRVRWTLFGLSHLGPAQAFWKSFEAHLATLSGPEASSSWVSFWLGKPEARLGELFAGDFGILPAQFARSSGWQEDIPGELHRLVLENHHLVDHLRTLVTFRPFAALPEQVKARYFRGDLRLIPSPQSLIMWYHPGYSVLRATLPQAAQIPLLHQVSSQEQSPGVRVPRSGWLDEEAGKAKYTNDAHRRNIRLPRSHRHERRERDDLARGEETWQDLATVALFSENPDHLGLYGKPMSRNCQIWDEAYRLVLNGPAASPAELIQARLRCQSGGRFGYRQFFPPMVCGEHEMYFHVPLMVYEPEDGSPRIFTDEGSGLMTAERNGTIESCFFPALVRQPWIESGLKLFPGYQGEKRGHPQVNLRKLHEWTSLLERPLPVSFARDLLEFPKDMPFTDWIRRLIKQAILSSDLESLLGWISDRVSDSPLPDTGPSLTYPVMSTREKAETYWKDIVFLSSQTWAGRNNADPVTINAGKTGGEAGKTAISGLPPDRGLDRLAHWLLETYAIRARELGAERVITLGRQNFPWKTVHHYPWSKSWCENQTDQKQECNLFCVIPGKNRAEAIILADHYDTAYMEDLYEPGRGGDKLRYAAAGADDNYSATAALLTAASVFLPMSLAGQLERDIWLVHLTGEEFPADCLGARNLVQALLNRTLTLTDLDGAAVDLSGAQVQGILVLDMIAHNHDRDKNVFQIAPGEGRASARMALAAHMATETWNRYVREVVARPGRKTVAATTSFAIPVTGEPPVPPTPNLLHMIGEIRPEWDSKSALYNTDGQIFSDYGFPVVLFMENYDIKRTGYHDLHDTMKNIDLDYGQAVTAIAIETAARLACSRSM